jgi:aminoglycoside phosphotransferase (APT) family kinase protein
VPGLDIGRVSDWMASPGIGARSPLRFDRFGHGKSNLTFEVADADGRRWVLRRPPLGRLLPGAHDVVREHRILAALEQTDVPVPRVTALAEPGEVADVPLLAMDYVEGFVVQDSAAAQLLPPARRLEVGLALCSALGRVHAVDLEGAGLDDLASHSPYAHRQLKRWHGQWERSRTRDIPEIDDLASRLRAAAPEPGELTLVHGDFHLRNVITSTADGSVLAILDWELCTLGDPLADLGGLFAYWPEPGEPATAVNPASTLPGFPSRDELAHEYARTTGRGLDALGFWHVLALWKVAIIAEGVLRRNRDEPLNAASTTSLRPEGVDELVSRAIATAEKEGI